MSLPTLYHSPVQLFECLTTKPDGLGSIMATCHHATVECETFTAKDVAAGIAAKLALFEELVVSLQNILHAGDKQDMWRVLNYAETALAKVKAAVPVKDTP